MEQETELLLEIGNGIEGELENDVLKSFPKGSDENITQITNGDWDEGKGDNECGVDLMEEAENDKVLELMIENSVLNCEKKKAESDVAFWKAKCEELESRVRVLENQLSSSTSGTPNVVVNPVIKTEAVKDDVATPLIHTLNGEIHHEKRNERSSRARKQLNYGEETRDNIAPATPAAGVINISDDDDDDDVGSSLNQHGHQQSMNKAQELSSGNSRTVKDESEIEDDIMHCYQGTPSLLSKRKRASRTVHSDTDSDADDNVPLHRLRKRYSNVDSDADDNVPFRRLRKRYSNVATLPSHQGQGVPQKDDETDDSESDSEGESLNGFIVSGSESDLSVADKPCERDEDEKSADSESEGNVDYVEVMSMIGRKKSHLVKWELEGDMLAAFGKDPLLCMKAVCALYRQQTSDEKSCKATIHHNQKGFSQFDGTRGSKLGEFLTNGDPEGGLDKSVEELKEFQPDGLEVCTTLATRYSKQLFAMYENKEFVA